MSVFGSYSRYYNLLYKDKDYQGEADYIAGLVRQYSGGKAKSLIDVGCGTGNHDVLLAKHGFEVDGVDRSEDMIRVGRQRAEGMKNLRFHLGDATDFRLGKKADAVVSLFHVMSYQTTNEALKSSFVSAFEHLAPGGIFVFDFWYGPGVLTDPPVLRVKKMEDESIKVLRVASPEIHPNRNVVDVNYEVLIEDKATGKLERLNETHHMRYLFKPELDFMLAAAGFKVVDFLEWMTSDREPGISTWNACIVASK
ncbi:MAG: methyltransferase domain-containing protein [Fibrobacteres bacterium]|jgi:SAM-dependent methyltransferase|nr:methyltransferase domain-containing protein [Fibrobacterota bacterium]